MNRGHKSEPADAEDAPVARVALFLIFSSMSLPSQTLAQYEALTQGAGLVELAEWSVIELTGKDRVQLVHAFTTGDVKKLAEAHCGEAFVTSPQGKTLGHALVLPMAERLLLVTTPGQAAKLIAHFDRYIIGEDVNLRDTTPLSSLWLAAGAQVAEILTQGMVGALPADPLAHATLRLGDVPVLVARVDWLAVPTFLLVAPRESAGAVGEQLLADGMTLCDRNAFDIVRLEAGWPLYGQDITDDNLPQEIGRDAQAISFTKGCYLGQETIARIDAVGHVNRHLVGVRLAGYEIPPAGTPLLAADKEVGRVTSAAWSPRLSAPLALALLKRSQAKPGQELTSSVGAATVVALPL
jgi:tRNA-modifying protein YgfZ